MSKFDFKRSSKRSDTVEYDAAKFREAKTNTGYAFFGAKSNPEDPVIIRTYLKSTVWLDSVDEFDDNAEIVLCGTRGAGMSISLADARTVLPYLQSVVEDAEQIREALTEVLPMKDSDEDDEDD